MSKKNKLTIKITVTSCFECPHVSAQTIPFDDVGYGDDQYVYTCGFTGQPAKDFVPDDCPCLYKKKVDKFIDSLAEGRE